MRENDNGSARTEQSDRSVCLRRLQITAVLFRDMELPAIAQNAFRESRPQRFRRMRQIRFRGGHGEKRDVLPEKRKLPEPAGLLLFLADAAKDNLCAPFGTGLAQKPQKAPHTRQLPADREIRVIGCIEEYESRFSHSASLKKLVPVFLCSGFPGEAADVAVAFRNQVCAKRLIALLLQGRSLCLNLSVNRLQL